MRETDKKMKTLELDHAVAQLRFGFFSARHVGNELCVTGARSAARFDQTNAALTNCVASVTLYFFTRNGFVKC